MTLVVYDGWGFEDDIVVGKLYAALGVGHIGRACASWRKGRGDGGASSGFVDMLKRQPGGRALIGYRRDTVVVWLASVQVVRGGRAFISSRCPRRTRLGCEVELVGADG